jgi:hypothetical protein
MRRPGVARHVNLPNSRSDGIVLRRTTPIT